MFKYTDYRQQGILSSSNVLHVGGKYRPCSRPARTNALAAFLSFLPAKIVTMARHSRKELLTLIRDMRLRLDKMEEMAKDIVPEKEWYTRTEFAKKQGLKPQTVSNYLARGEFGDNQRKKDGRWHIHKSEL